MEGSAMDRLGSPGLTALRPVRDYVCIFMKIIREVISYLFI